MVQESAFHAQRSRKDFGWSTIDHAVFPILRIRGPAIVNQAARNGLLLIRLRPQLLAKQGLKRTVVCGAPPSFTSVGRELLVVGHFSRRPIATQETGKGRGVAPVRAHRGTRPACLQVVVSLTRDDGEQQIQLCVRQAAALASSPLSGLAKRAHEPLNKRVAVRGVRGRDFFEDAVGVHLFDELGTHELTSAVRDTSRGRTVAIYPYALHGVPDSAGFFVGETCYLDPTRATVNDDEVPHPKELKEVHLNLLVEWQVVKV